MLELLSALRYTDRERGRQAPRLVHDVLRRVAKGDALAHANGARDLLTIVTRSIARDPRRPPPRR